MKNFFTFKKGILATLIGSSILLGCDKDPLVLFNLRNYKNDIPGIETNNRYTFIKIKVLDGYLGNAVVCADFDYNFECDENVEQKITDENGNAVLRVKEHIYNSFMTHHLLVTVRKDNVTNNLNGQLSKVTTDLVMMSDTTSEDINIISPYSTLAQCFVENGSTITKQEAMQMMAQALGLPVKELYEDYNKTHGIALIAAEILVRLNLLPKNSEDIQDLPLSPKEAQKILKKIRERANILLDEGYSLTEIIESILQIDFKKLKRVNQKPFADFGIYIDNLNVKLTNKSIDEDSEDIIYKWEISDGQTFFDKDIDVKFKEPGTYVIKLTVSDNEHDISIKKEVTVSNTFHCTEQPIKASCQNFNNKIICNAYPITINNCSTFKNSSEEQIKYIWKFEDEFEYYGQEVTHLIKDNSKQKVVLTVTDGIAKEEINLEYFSKQSMPSLPQIINRNK